MNKKNLISWCGGLAFILLASSCQIDVLDSNKVGQDQVVQRYEAKYSEATGKIWAYAMFSKGYEGGESIDLQYPSQVTFDGQEMQKKAFLGLSYELNYSQNFKPTYRFNWTDTSNKLYVNIVTVVPITLTTIPAVVSQSTGFSVDFIGEPTSNDDRMELTYSTQNSIGSVTANSVVGSHTITVTPQNLLWISFGTVRFTIVRNRSARLQEGTPKGGSIAVKYKTREFSVNLTN